MMAQQTNVVFSYAVQMFVLESSTWSRIVIIISASKQTMLEYQWPMKKSNFHVGHQGPKLINDKFSKAYSTSTKNIALLPGTKADTASAQNSAGITTSSPPKH
ncbi:unnamed protein product [Fusarium graminearum]|nr:unnamed protein product [Fusarium graminearum]